MFFNTFDVNVTRFKHEGTLQLKYGTLFWLSTSKKPQGRLGNCVLARQFEQEQYEFEVAWALRSEYLDLKKSLSLFYIICHKTIFLSADKQKEVLNMEKKPAIHQLTNPG